MKIGVAEKISSQKQKKKSYEIQNLRRNRFLITVNVLGSAGPLKFVVNEDDRVGGVIDTALKLYAREERLPVFGSDPNNFLLYHVNAGSDALNPSESIGSCGGRNFILCKKQMKETESKMIDQKGSNSWKAWFNKSFNLKTLSH